MCLVEVEGVNKPIASCTVKISDNLSIYTNSAMVRKLDKLYWKLYY